jgi:hypothetical protein
MTATHSPAHAAAVTGLPQGVADAMLDWAAALGASVPEMMAWGRMEHPEAFGIGASEDEEAETPVKPKRRVRQRAKANDAEAARPRQDSGEAREPETPPRTAVQSDAPASEHAPASPLVTLTLSRRQVQDIARALSEFARRRTGRGCHPRPSIQADAERLELVWRAIAERGDEAVTLPLDNWRGVTVPVGGERRPGIVGLLAAAAGPADGDRERWPYQLTYPIKDQLRHVA